MIKLRVAWKGIGLIRHLSSHVSMFTLEQMYKMFVRPHLDYCDVIYHVPPHQEYASTFFNLKYLMKSVESTQYQAARAVSGLGKVLIHLNYIRSWVGSTCRKEDGRVDFFNFTKSLTI